MVNLVNNILTEVKQVALREPWLPEARAATFAQEPPGLSSQLETEFQAAWGVLNGSRMAEFWVCPHAGRWQSPSSGCWDAGSPRSRGWCAWVTLCIFCPEPHGDHSMRYQRVWGLGEQRVEIPKLGDTWQPVGRCPDRRGPRGL